MRRRFEEVLKSANPRYLVLEDYAMGKVDGGQSRAFSIGEWGGIIRMVTWEYGIDTLLVSPTALKACIVGNGRAKGGREGKKLVMSAIEEKFGYSFTQNDEADAFGLMAIGEVRFSAYPYPASLISSMRPKQIAKYEVIKGGRLRLISK